ncbi:MAG: OmpA family protein [Bacteroidota bacterium]
MKKTFVLLLVLSLGISACVRRSAYRQVVTQKSAADSTILYLNYQLERAEIRAEGLRRQYQNDYEEAQQTVKALRQNMRSQQARLQQQISERDTVVNKWQQIVERNYYPTRALGLTAREDSTQTRTWLKEIIYFESGQTKLSDSKLAQLDRIVDALKNHPRLELQIIGHTDAVPPRRGDNLDVSYRRAKQMYHFLVRKGIDAARLSIVARGANRPAIDHTSAESATNRRVEFVLLTRNDIDAISEKR